ncbi:MAG: hypothetical protein ABSE07_08810 [Methanoregula sp.]|jgi:hypothetical protein
MGHIVLPKRIRLRKKSDTYVAVKNSDEFFTSSNFAFRAIFLAIPAQDALFVALNRWPKGLYGLPKGKMGGYSLACLFISPAQVFPS